MNTNTSSLGDFVVGIDLGDKVSMVCVLSGTGTELKECTVATEADSFVKFFNQFSSPSSVIVAMETGTHSPWLSLLLEGRGFEVFVGNARKLRAIWSSPNKNDVRDAQMLARIARFDRQLLSPIQHRNRDAQMDLAILKARDAVVSCRTDLVNTVRGLVKSSGYRLSSCSTEAFPKTVASEIPSELWPALSPLLTTITHLTVQIRRYDKKIKKLCEKCYPETERLQQIKGVGPVTSLAYVLTLESPDRFRKSRNVGPYLGLVPKRDQSGQTDKPLSITKAGDNHLRRLLVTASNYILGPFGPDCDLRRYGERIAGRGGKVARRKAKIAVARKLAVVLHHLWKTGEKYQPIMKKNRKQKIAA